MWLILQQPEPRDYVIATGETHSVRDFVEAAFSHVNLDWHDYVKTDDLFYRPAEVDILLGDPTRAHTELGWKARTHFAELVRMMVDADMELA
jgi:GDPmannose 4,6-dehydratase